MTKQKTFGVKKRPPKTPTMASPYSIRAYNLIVRRMDAIKKEVLSIVKEIEVENEKASQLNLGVDQ